MHANYRPIDIDAQDIGPATRCDAPTLTQMFAAYFEETVAFDELRAAVLAAHRALCSAGTPLDAIARFMRRSLDTGAARATPVDNVYRFNAIHDELVFWLAGLRTQRISDALDAEPLLADRPTRYRTRDELSD